MQIRALRGREITLYGVRAIWWRLALNYGTWRCAVWTSALGLVVLTAAAQAHGMGGQSEWAAFGIPGKVSAVTRTVSITAGDMRYSLKGLDVKTGETIRFVITNRGPSNHEFVIGNHAFHAQHIKEMEAMPDMPMNEANSVDLKPGESKSLIWQFTKSGDYLFGCDIPGHFEAGMSGAIRVR
ncbi:MAG TPA: plastocyanin/azurin family copper-binding protein [Rhizomicrobium sp.]|jgi:uncharacterized cupredoxin-like copper-binding protein